MGKASKHGKKSSKLMQKRLSEHMHKSGEVSIPTSTDRRLQTRGLQLLGPMPRLWVPNPSFFSQVFSF